MDDEILVSFEELQSHASREDAWIQVEGIVYNLTDLYAAHAEELPDTFEQLFDVAGADATEVFQDISQGQDFLELLSDFKVGIIHQRDGDDAPGPADSPLTEDLMATNLSRLTKTPDGTSFAYSRIALTVRNPTTGDIHLSDIFGYDNMLQTHPPCVIVYINLSFLFLFFIFFHKMSV
eukprot:TRINITY_DN10528_c0_g1_i2.p2 TRINITY_DN10528_c0_g1~~TRINITY_DN10528_c0_g1_i2.p2  ORF type:complete len:178 (+),score=37.90 TRINITY_DN10528_c0_g1_i2:106-639(+)